MKSLSASQVTVARREGLDTLEGPGSSFKARLAKVNQELWLVLSLFVVAGLMNWLVSSQHMIIGFYTLPTIFSGYVYGRRHAVLTAVASIVIVAALALTTPSLFATPTAPTLWVQSAELITWAGLLIVTAYTMGTLYQRQERRLRELRETYFGVLTILQQFVSNDKYTHNHSYRVAIYASAIARYMGFDEPRVDDVRAAALLHDLGKLDVSRDLLHRASSLTQDEVATIGQRVPASVALLQPVEGSLRRVVAIVLALHGSHEGREFVPPTGDEMPMEARVLAIADAYDTLTSDRTYRRAVTPFEAKEIIIAGAGTNFDASVVEAFAGAFENGQMEIPEAPAV